MHGESVPPAEQKKKRDLPSPDSLRRQGRGGGAGSGQQNLILKPILLGEGVGRYELESSSGGRRRTGEIRELSSPWATEEKRKRGKIIYK